MTVPLVESAGAAGGSGQPQAHTMDVQPSASSMTGGTGGQPALEFQPGGSQGKPVIRVGSTSLGYEDVLPILVVIQATASVVRVWRGS